MPKNKKNNKGKKNNTTKRNEGGSTTGKKRGEQPRFHVKCSTCVAKDLYFNKDEEAKHKEECKKKKQWEAEKARRYIALQQNANAQIDAGRNGAQAGRNGVQARRNGAQAGRNGAQARRNGA